MNRLKIELQSRDSEPKHLRFLQVTIELCTLQQAFGGYTSPVQADSTHPVAFYQGDSSTALCGSNSCRISAGTPTQDDNVIVVLSVAHYQFTSITAVE
jgi:hypothetical protein